MDIIEHATKEEQARRCEVAQWLVEDLKAVEDFNNERSGVSEMMKCDEGFRARCNRVMRLLSWKDRAVMAVSFIKYTHLDTMGQHKIETPAWPFILIGTVSGIAAVSVLILIRIA